MNAPLESLFGTNPAFFDRFVTMTTAVGLRYFLFAGLAWLLAYGLFRNRWSHRKIIPRLPQASEVRREVGYSLVTL
ncbi:MAG: hypothetical protein ACKPGI_07720, partial [Verrucomicrobiota bacterium]